MALMGRNRLEAFSDGVLAIIITIMAFEMKTPDGGDLVSLRPLVPVLLSYVLSFAYIAIYWNNHHHMMHTVKSVNGAILWANMHLLFWLSLVPFASGWIGESGFMPLPMALYGGVLLMAAASYWVLQTVILWAHGKDSLLAQALGLDLKGKASLALYAGGIAAAFWQPWVAGAIYAFVAFMWLIPDRRIERFYRD